MAVVLAAAFGDTPADWLRLDVLYRLSVVDGNESFGVEKTALFYDIAPVREMQRRGWITETRNADSLEAQLKKFFATDKLDRENRPKFPVAMLRHSPLPSLSATEWAWLFRARQIADAWVDVAVFDPARLDSAERKLRLLESHPKEARHVSAIMAEAGIRFVVVEPLPSIKIDGAAFWLNEQSPVIALSARVDRIDNLWFTIMHEWAHIRNNDAFSADCNILGEEEEGVLVRDEIERSANDQASASLVPNSELDSFIRRVGPLYSKTRIIQFANRIKIHPGIIVGQLQYRREIGWGANREMLAKMREPLIETTLTDGWGRTISPGIL